MTASRDAPVVPYARAARELLRSTLLDATREQLRTRSWADVTMAAVAAAGGVSRQTLYKEFGSRRELAQAYLLREVDTFLHSVEQAVTRHLDDPVTALSAAFGVFLEAAAEDPMVRAVVAGDSGDELLALITTHGEPMLVRATDGLAAFLLRSWPMIALADGRLLAECLVRLGISHASLPTGPSAITADSVATLLGPYIERCLATGSHDRRAQA